MDSLRIKRIYDEPSVNDGCRILVDRLWPRGVSKERARLDEWSKDIAPSPELRKWFNHEPEKFTEFAAKYQDELAKSSSVGEFLKLIKNKPVVTLLYGAKDPRINHAVVLAQFLKRARK